VGSPKRESDRITQRLAVQIRPRNHETPLPKCSGVPLSLRVRGRHAGLARLDLHLRITREVRYSLQSGYEKNHFDNSPECTGARGFKSDWNVCVNV
jgi:hypothetical protein